MRKPVMPHLTLYNYWRSSASHRVRIALALKALAYEYVSVNLARRRAVGEHAQGPQPDRLRPVPRDRRRGVRRVGRHRRAARRALSVSSALPGRTPRTRPGAGARRDRQQRHPAAAKPERSAPGLARTRTCSGNGRSISSRRDWARSRRRSRVWNARAWRDPSRTVTRLRPPTSFSSLKSSWLGGFTWTSRRSGGSRAAFDAAMQLEAFRQAAPEEQPDAIRT